MAKGLFTQTMCVLTTGGTTVEELRAALCMGGFEIVKEIEAEGDSCFGGATLLVPFRPEVNGYVAVDIVNEPWPDAMGDPKLSPMVFGAWSMGHYGPLAFPGGLERALKHAWAWQDGEAILASNRGFVRARLSYAFGAKDDDPVFPDNCDPCRELMFLSRIINTLLDMPSALCYFNPNGEVLRDSSKFREIWVACEQEKHIPLPLWTNVRFFNLNETFHFMDTVGNGQLDIRDIEAVFPKSAYNPGDVEYYLRNVTHYLLDMSRDIQSGESIDGPGETDLSWTIAVLDAGLIEPPREVLRLCPKANSKEIRGLTQS